MSIIKSPSEAINDAYDEYLNIEHRPLSYCVKCRDADTKAGMHCTCTKDPVCLYCLQLNCENRNKIHEELYRLYKPVRVSKFHMDLGYRKNYTSYDVFLDNIEINYCVIADQCLKYIIHYDTEEIVNMNGLVRKIKMDKDNNPLYLLSTGVVEIEAR